MTESGRQCFVEGLAFAIPTALVALTAADGLVLADRLNRPLGLNRDAWTARAERCLRAGADSGGEPAPTCPQGLLPPHR